MKLTAAQTKAMPLLVSGLQQKKVAKQVNVTPQTISTWMSDPEFVAHLNQLRFNALDTARDALRGLAYEAVEELRSIMLTSKNDETRRKAIIDILTMLGMKDPADGSYGWGIGPTNPKSVVKQWERDANPELARLLGNRF